MVDRQVDLDGIPKDFIVEQGFEFLLEDGYIVPEGILLTPEEIDDAVQTQNEIYNIFELELKNLVSSRNFDFLNLPDKMLDLIVHSYEANHCHLIGRFDFAGGVDELPLKLLEYNADTPTMIPESSIIQESFMPFYDCTYQFNYLRRNLEVAFNRLTIGDSTRAKTLLATSLGFEEDVTNAKFIMNIAEEEGFEVMYADLPNIEFAKNEGIFVEVDNGDSYKFDYLFKMIPWEFVCFEEPELLDILHNLILNDLVYVMNPAFALVYQSKVFLDYVSQKHNIPALLKSSRKKEDFKGSKFVSKVSFGRLGHNITVFNELGGIVEITDGDYGAFEKVYQEFAHLYKDEYGEYYQLGMFNVNSLASSISFRRGEKLIIDDDCQFIPHFQID